MSLSVILTCYNEVPAIFTSYERIVSFMEMTALDYEVIVVDDGSCSETRQRLKEYFGTRPGVKLILGEVNEGRGAAVTKGIKAGAFEYAGFIDTDLEIPEYSLLPLYFACKRSSAEVAIGWRVYRLGGNLNNWFRYFLSRGYFLLANFFLKLDFLDTETGIKIFKREAILPVLESVEAKRWFWDTEIIAESKKYGLSVIQEPVFVIRSKGKKSSVRFFKDTRAYLSAVYRYRRRQKRCLQ